MIASKPPTPITMYKAPTITSIQPRERSMMPYDKQNRPISASHVGFEEHSGVDQCVYDVAKIFAAVDRPLGKQLASPRPESVQSVIVQMPTQFRSVDVAAAQMNGTVKRRAFEHKQKRLTRIFRSGRDVCDPLQECFALVVRL